MQALLTYFNHILKEKLSSEFWTNLKTNVWDSTFKVREYLSFQEQCMILKTIRDADLELTVEWTTSLWDWICFSLFM